MPYSLKRVNNFTSGYLELPAETIFGGEAVILTARLEKPISFILMLSVFLSYIQGAHNLLSSPKFKLQLHYNNILNIILLKHQTMSNNTPMTIWFVWNNMADSLRKYKQWKGLKILPLQIKLSPSCI